MNVAMQPIESTNIKAAGFADGSLFVKFRTGTLYEYKGVPEKVFTDLLAAESAGSFFHVNIKNSYTFTQVTGV